MDDSLPVVKGETVVVTGSQEAGTGETSGWLRRPRRVALRRVSPIAARSGERLLSEPRAGTQPCRREPPFMPEAV